MKGVYYNTLSILSVCYWATSRTWICFFISSLYSQQEIGNCLQDIETDDPPMQVVGKFLVLIFANHKLMTCSDSSPTSPHHLTSLSLSSDVTQVLHSCPGFTQGQLIQMVIEICSGIPEAFEVFHCHPTTTEREMNLFLNRTVKHGLRSLVLEVNRLPFKLQEVRVFQLWLVRSLGFTRCWMCFILL